MLMNYPRVQGFIVQRIGPPRVRGGQARRSEEEVMSDVQRTITLLIARNARVNYTSIAREIERNICSNVKKLSQSKNDCG